MDVEICRGGIKPPAALGAESDVTGSKIKADEKEILYFVISYLGICGRPPH